MSGLYEEFEKQHTNRWFSAGWQEVEPKTEELNAPVRKDIDTLQDELVAIKAEIDNISQKKLRLANLSKLYNN